MTAKATLRIALERVELLPLERTTDDHNVLTLKALIFEPLLRWHDGDVRPGLVDSWELRDGGRTWRLALRPGARFHDGSPCTVEDVQRMMALLREARDSFGMPGAYAPYLRDLVLRPVSATELEIENPEPNADLADILAEIFVARPAPDGQPALGTGPYRVVDYQPRTYARLAAAGDPGAYAYPDVLLLAMPDAAERYTALAEGRADVATGLESLAALPPVGDLVWGRAGHTLSVTGFLNGFTEPFCRPEARLAANLALDVPRIIQEVWSGLGEPATTVVSPYHYGFPAGLKPLERDVARAAELFGQCPMPAELVLRTPEHMPDRSVAVSELIREQLGEIGIRVRIEVGHDRPQYARDVGAKQIGHIALFDSSPHSTYRVLQEKVSSRKRGMWWQGVVDPEADHLIAEAHAAISAGERAVAYGRALAWLANHPHWLYLFHPVRLFAYRPGLRGIATDHAGLLKLPVED